MHVNKDFRLHRRGALKQCVDPEGVVLKIARRADRRPILKLLELRRREQWRMAPIARSTNFGETPDAPAKASDMMEELPEGHSANHLAWEGR